MLKIKYTGSKARIADDISRIIQKCLDENKIQKYIEPFCGGCNVISHIKCNDKIANDNNEYLIELWKYILADNNVPDFISRDEWYKVKYNFCDYEKWYIGLCGVVASYNGCWFTSYGGCANTKGGKIRNYYLEGLKNIEKQKTFLKDVKFQSNDYTIFSNESGSFIYCDAPYVQGKHRYKESRTFDHSKYYDWLRNISKNNFVIVSEYEMPNDFICIWEKQLSKTHPDQRMTSPTEKLFTYKNGLYIKTQ